MLNCRINYPKNFLKPARLVFEGENAPKDVRDLQRAADAAEREEAAKPKQPDMLKKDEEQKVDDLQKKIADKIAVPGIKPDTEKAYKTFTDKHDKYENLKKQGDAVAQDRKELVTYLRDVLMKGGTDTALVAAYRKEAAAQKVIDEQQKQEAAKAEVAQKAEETKIMANVLDFQVRHVSNMVKYARSNNPNNANNDINMLTVDLNGMSMDAALLQKLKSGTPEEQARDSYDIKNTEARLNRHDTAYWINKCRELNQVLILTGVAPYQAYTPLAEAKQMGRDVGAMTTPGAAPAAPAAKPVAPKAPASRPAPQAPAAPPPAPAKPAATPPPAPAPKPPVTTPVVPPPQPVTPRDLPVAKAPAATPAPQPAAQPAKAATAKPSDKPAATVASVPAATPARPSTTVDRRKQSAAERSAGITTMPDGSKVDAQGQRSWDNYPAFKSHIQAEFGITERQMEASAGRIINQILKNPQAKRSPDLTVNVPMTLYYSERQLDSQKREMNDENGNPLFIDKVLKVTLSIPNAYNYLSKNQKPEDLFKAPDVKYIVTGSGKVERGPGGEQKVTLDDTAITAGP